MKSLGILGFILLVFQVAADLEKAGGNNALHKRGWNIAIFVLCEHQRGVLRCPGNMRLKILQANYGRTDRFICPKGPIRTTNCISSFSSRLIRYACDGRNACLLDATNGVFGDPCVGTFKYIKIFYKCV
ncbi:L-rhamnose-binding lectin CSL3-like [Actinia tenebrosa]|uniref:L-rhamnose-binding lectin CSL3-like n=1 Tax=Actinia tenebrosa TaxID=6105 RepID=A0A6P8ILQ1_ACTTE|nr:L-rhamnose-binding lectin CSL3-like [Actinia tenebrosa]